MSVEFISQSIPHDSKEGVDGRGKEARLSIVSLDAYFPKNELESWKKLFHEFHGMLLIDDKLTDSKVLLISIYMCCNKKQKPNVPYSAVKDLFLELLPPEHIR